LAEADHCRAVAFGEEELRIDPPLIRYQF